jgi:CheY-specific phosphatase CheX
MNPTFPRFSALTLGRRMGGLGGELAALGNIVLSSDEPAALLNAMDTRRDVSVVLVSSDVGQDQAAHVLSAVKQRYATLPVIWLGSELGGAPLGDFRAIPDALLHEPVSTDAILHTITELLHRRHTETVSRLLVSVVEQALRDTYAIETESPVVVVNATHRLVGEINSIVAFCGGGMSGCLLLSADESTLAGIHARVLPNAPPASRMQAEDLAGEIANLAVGKLKFALDQLGVACEIGTPLLVGSAGMILRRTNAQPSLVAEFNCREGIVRGELMIDRCSDVESERLERAPELPATKHDSELCFL